MDTSEQLAIITALRHTRFKAIKKTIGNGEKVVMIITTKRNIPDIYLWCWDDYVRLIKGTLLSS